MAKTLKKVKASKAKALKAKPADDGPKVSGAGPSPSYSPEGA